MNIDHKIIPFIVIKSDDLDNLVKSVYPYPNYDFIGAEECGNDTDHAFYDVNGNIPEYDREDVDEVKNGTVEWCNNYDVLQALCEDGHIIKGDYLITVSW